MQGHTVPQTPRLRIGWNVPGTMTRLGLHMGMILAWCRYFPTHLPDLVVATSAGAILMFRGLALAGLYAVPRVRTSRLYHWPARLLIVAVAGVAAWRVSYGLPSAILFCAGLFMFELLLERSLGVFLKEVGPPFDNTPLRKLLLDQDVPRMAFLAKTELRILAADVEGPGPIWYSNHEPLMCDPQNPEHGERFVECILGWST